MQIKTASPSLDSLSPEQESELRDLIEQNRARALWSLPSDYLPIDLAGARRTLERIAARGDRATFIRARRLLALLT
jgi:hypothetical protein